MSYNIDSIRVVANRSFTFPEGSVEKFVAENEDDLPEAYPRSTNKANDLIAQGHFWWSGEGSGHAEELLRKLLALGSGAVDLILTWEGGDSFTGLRVARGRVTEHEVVHALGKEKSE